MERRLAYANSKGLFVMLFLAWGGKRAGEEAAKTWLDFPNDEARLRYARYVVGRFSAYNAGFCVAGEWDIAGGDAKQEAFVRALGQHVYEHEPHGRLITLHASPNGKDGGSVKRFADEAWMSLADFRNGYDNLHAGMLAARRGDKPVVSAGYGYFFGEKNTDAPANSRTIDDLRHATWDIVMTGGSFVTGFRGTVRGGKGDPGAFNPDDPRHAVWLAQLKHLRTLFLKLVPEDGKHMRGQWDWLRQGDALVSSPLGRGKDAVEERGALGPPPHAYWSLYKDGFGHTQVVYVRGYDGAYTIRVDDDRKEPLEAVRGRVYSVRRFDLRTGEYAREKDHHGDGPLSLTPPDKQDWVFVIKRENPYQY
ncbi:MAG: DUF4038 domain-containing protein [Blastocatellia bacterium]